METGLECSRERGRDLEVLLVQIFKMKSNPNDCSFNVELTDWLEEAQVARF